MALTFTGALTDDVVLGNAASLNNLAAHTMLAWVYPTALTANRRISQKSANPNSQHNFTVDVSGAAYARRGFSTTSNLCKSNTDVLAADTWCFVAWTFDETANPMSRLYYGRLASAAVETSSYATAQQGVGTRYDESARSLTIGNSDPAGDDQAFPGSIAFFGYWNRVLTLPEIQQQQFRPYPSSGCVALLHLGLGGVGQQPDWSGHGNNGTVTGAAWAAHVPLVSPFAWLHREIEAPYVVAAGGWKPAWAVRQRHVVGGGVL